jgi:CheY-like chemotaxis protein
VAIGPASKLNPARRWSDLIVSDWKMRGMNGRQLHERLLKTNRGAANRMSFMTGDV